MRARHRPAEGVCYSLAAPYGRESLHGDYPALLLTPAPSNDRRASERPARTEGARVRTPSYGGTDSRLPPGRKFRRLRSVAHRYGSGGAIPMHARADRKKEPAPRMSRLTHRLLCGDPMRGPYLRGTGGTRRRAEAQDVGVESLTRHHPLRDHRVAVLPRLFLRESNARVAENCPGVVVSTGVRRRHPAVDAARELGLDGEQIGLSRRHPHGRAVLDLNNLRDDRGAL